MAMHSDSFLCVNLRETDFSSPICSKSKEGEYMKKKLIICILICVMALSYTNPVMATNVVVAESLAVNTELAETAEQEIAPFNEMTRIYVRTYHGVLQFRVWSITNGRWLTDWTNF